jgi:hypothetical protein
MGSLKREIDRRGMATQWQMPVAVPSEERAAATKPVRFPCVDDQRMTISGNSFVVCAHRNDSMKPDTPKATLDQAPKTTGRDGAIDFAAKVEASHGERVVLNDVEDFIAHADGPIELTAAGLKRAVVGHVAGHDVVIEINGRDVLLVRAPKV